MEKRRKRTGSKRYLLFPLLAMVFMLSAASVHASSDENVTVLVPVKQVFTVTQGTAPQGGDVFSYELSPVTPGAPMPEGSKDGIYSFSMSGSQELLLDGITYTKVGDYEYRIGQTVEYRKEGYGYDERAYILAVSVGNKEGGGLRAELILKNGAGEKTEKAAFENTYAGKTTVVTKPGGTSPNYTTPSNQQRRPLVKTGDETNLFLLAALLIGSFLTLVFTSIAKRRKGNA